MQSHGTKWTFFESVDNPLTALHNDFLRADKNIVFRILLFIMLTINNK
jgi:hypothetical protein